MKLRPYQEEASAKGVWYLKNYKKPFIIQAATGSGKSILIADICHKLDEPVLILQPSRELVIQNHQKMLLYNIDDVGIYSASLNKKEMGKYVMATIGSICKKPELFKHFKYVIVDEAHLIDPKRINSMYMSFFKAIDCTNICGLTATPYRITQRYLKTKTGGMYSVSQLSMINRIFPFFFKKIVFKVETKELIDQGYLAPIDYVINPVNFTPLKLNSNRSDFTEESLKVWADKQQQKLVDTIRHIDTKHKLNLVFCPSIEQSNVLCQSLKEYGLIATVVTSETPKKEREQIVDDFRNGKIKHLINVGVFSVGFDVPQLDCITLCRPTMSLALYYQQVGRGVRIDPNNPDKRLTVYDLAGCVERFGRIETIEIAKEDDGFRDRVESEKGVMTDTPFAKFLISKKEDGKNG